LLPILRIHPGYKARLIPTQQLTIKIADTTSLSFKESVMVGDGANIIIRDTNAMAMQAKKIESKTSLVGLKSIP